MQALDARADQLRHQLRTLPEHAQHEEATRQHTDLENRVRDVRIRVDDLSVEQRKADADVEQVKSRRTRDQERIDQGLITNPKDLERMQGELQSLERRIGTLEDAELEVMQQLEDAQRELEQLTVQLGTSEDTVRGLQQRRDRRSAEIEGELTSVAEQRDAGVTDLPEDLLKLYERLREAKGGVGAALLRARACQGCMLTLDNAELAVIKQSPADEVIRCEECQRILVRTDESGL